MNDFDDLSRQKVACMFVALGFEENYRRLRREFWQTLAEKAEDLFCFRKIFKSISAESWEQAQVECDFAKKSGVKLLSILDHDYPSNLREIPDPPLVLYIRGLVQEPSFALGIVGARAGTRAACQFASLISKEATESRGQVVSGLALGIDGAAHRGALAAESKFSPGIAVLGSGLECIYPTVHKNLAAEIVERGGAVISEYRMRTSPLKHHFPERNRIISGLSDFVLVVEASLRSGSLITARFALEQGRDVGAVPGPINNAKNEGSNELIAQGAMLVRTFEDIVSGMPRIKRAILQSGERNTKLAAVKVRQACAQVIYSSEEERGRAKQILAIIEHEGKAQLDLIVEVSGCEFLEVQDLLSKMELGGDVIRGAGEFYECGR